MVVLSDVETAEVLEDIQERLSRIEEKLEDKDSSTSGGRTGLTLFKDDGSPTPVTAQLLSEAKEKGRKGLTADDVSITLEENGHPNGKNISLKTMKKIDKKYSKYKYLSGSGPKPSKLVYKP